VRNTIEHIFIERFALLGNQEFKTIVMKVRKHFILKLQWFAFLAIETVDITCFDIATVTLYRSVWIETKKTPHKTISNLCHTLQECVD
jgi:hypothetical protein